MPNDPLKAVIEAILFVSDEPVSADRLAEAAGEDVTVSMVHAAVEDLLADYRNGGRAFTIERIAGGYQLLTRPEYNRYLRQLVRQRAQQRFTQAALETLAIIAYKQPVSRAEIEDIRGVACGDMVRTLIEKGLVRVAGKSPEIGRALLYGTTKKFLQAFGLSSIKDLPDSKDLVEP